MDEDDYVRLPPIPREVRKEFREMVKENYGGIRGFYRVEVEKAIREYMRANKGGDTHDRLKRIEDSLEELAEDRGDSSEPSTAEKTKDSAVSSTTANRLEAIRGQIANQSGGTTIVHESIINKAIEDNAGSSTPTIRRYKQMLKQRHHVFENPAPEMSNWFLDGEAFVEMVESNFPERTQEVAEEYGEEWYDDIRDSLEDDGDPSFH